MKKQAFFQFAVLPKATAANQGCKVHSLGFPSTLLSKTILWLLLAGTFLFVQIQGLQAQQEDSLASDIFIKRMDRLVLPETDEEDGDLEDHDDLPASRFRNATQLPDKASLWNNRAFVKAEDLNIVSDNDEPPILAITASDACALPIVEPELEPVYASVKAHMPLYLPFRHSKVGIWQGFYYNKGTRHGAIDYGRGSIPSGDDPTFGVYAIAEGEVIDVGWKNSGGNFVVIEHTAPDGFKYKSSYIHLRNGFSHDLEKAKNTSGKYQKFAKLPNPSKLCWGTEQQKVKVKKGQKVKAGQFLAWAGNTGSGGIGFILEDDGNLKTRTPSLLTSICILRFMSRIHAPESPVG